MTPTMTIQWGLDIDGFITKPFLGQKDPENPLSKCATGLDFS